MKINHIKTFQQASEDHDVPEKVIQGWICAGLLHCYQTSDGKSFITSEDIEELKILENQARYQTLQEVSNQIHKEVLQVMDEFPQLDYASCLDSVLAGNVQLKRLYFFVIHRVEKESGQVKTYNFRKGGFYGDTD